jgi:CobQ-like glutamine amidotransferase family enzyme
VVCDSSCKGQKLVIAHLLPDLLNLYGDGGNVSVLARRAADRGFDVEVRRLNYGDPIKLDDVNIVFLGGAPDREQRLAARVLADARDELAVFVNRGGALLAICGGYQMLGRTWILEGEDVAGLDILPVETRRPGAGSNTDRMVGNIVLTSPLAARPVVGYENHAGRTYLDAGAEPFGCVVSKHGFGNNDTDSQRNDGVVYKNAIGTYLHGPILPKNPEIADWLISRGLEDVDINSAQATVGEGEASKSFALCALDDALEYAANDYMAKRLI